MARFTKTQVFILPHAEDYRKHYQVSLDEILLTLNDPDDGEKVFEDHFSAARTFGDRRVFIDYYITLPLQVVKDELYAIVDFVGIEARESLLN